MWFGVMLSFIGQLPYLSVTSSLDTWNFYMLLMSARNLYIFLYILVTVTWKEPKAETTFEIIPCLSFCSQTMLNPVCAPLFWTSAGFYHYKAPCLCPIVATVTLPPYLLNNIICLGSFLQMRKAENHPVYYCIWYFDTSFFKEQVRMNGKSKELIFFSRNYNFILFFFFSFQNCDCHLGWFSFWFVQQYLHWF